jgi:cytoskeletal protein RodZ
VRITPGQNTATFTLPANTVVAGGGYLVIGRASDQAGFENYWGVILGSDVTYLRPQTSDVVNANAGSFILFSSTSSTWSLLGVGGATIDGPTVVLGETRVEQRNVPVGASNNGNSWTDVSAVNGAVPGATPGAGQAANAVGPNGCYISELADTLDVTMTNESIFEYIEIHCP